MEKLCFTYPNDWTVDGKDQETEFDVAKNSRGLSVENSNSVTLVYRTGLVNKLNSVESDCSKATWLQNITARTALAKTADIEIIEYVWKPASAGDTHMALIGRVYCPGLVPETRD